MSDGRESALEVDDLSVFYGKTRALDGISLHVERGETVSVIGPNGAGKTTLFNALSKLVDYEGTIRLFGSDIGPLTPQEVIDRGLIHVTEGRDLFPFFSVHENLLMGAFPREDEAAVQESLQYVYDLFPRLEERREQRAETLSGGEQQMLAIGRSLMADPEVLILDEPTIGLAPVIIEDIDEVFGELHDRGITILLAEQNTTFAMRHAERIYLLETGEITRSGPTDEMREDEYIQDAYIGVT